MHRLSLKKRRIVEEGEDGSDEGPSVVSPVKAPAAMDVKLVLKEDVMSEPESVKPSESESESESDKEADKEDDDDSEDGDNNDDELTAQLVQSQGTRSSVWRSLLPCSPLCLLSTAACRWLCPHPADTKEGNADALISRRPIAVQREAILPCLTVPLKGVSLNARKPFKLPSGVCNTEKSEELRKKKTLGARLNMCKCVRAAACVCFQKILFLATRGLRAACVLNLLSVAAQLPVTAVLRCVFR
jgi:hypothetical protein